MLQESYELLAHAIIHQAVHDYICAIFRLRRNPHDYEAILMIDDVERFIKSQWCETLSEIDGNKLWRKLLDYSKEILMRKDKEQDLINGCKLVKPSAITADFPYCSDILYLDEHNLVGIENNDIRVRIDGLIVTSEKKFVKIMDALVLISKRWGINKLYFADSLSPEVLNMFLRYGFIETSVEPFNHYLDFDIPE